MSVAHPGVSCRMKFDCMYMPSGILMGCFSLPLVLVYDPLVVMLS